MGFKFRRATDLFPFGVPPAICPTLTELNSADDVAELINNLERSRFTGVLKISCQSQKSRAAAALHEGRVIGCVYLSTSHLVPANTQQSVRMMLRDCATKSAQALTAPVDEKVLVAFSALFRGYPIERDDALTAHEYVNHMRSWTAVENQTMCMAVNLTASNSIMLELAYDGKPVGVFIPDNQQYWPTNEITLKRITSSGEKVIVAVSILPPELRERASFALRSGW